MRKYYRSSRGVETGYQTKYDLADGIHGIRVQNMLKTTTMAEYQQWVDFAAAHKLWLVIVYHGVLSSPGDFDTTPALFDQQLAYLNTKGIAVRTMQDALDELCPKQVFRSPRRLTTRLTRRSQVSRHRQRRALEPRFSSPPTNPEAPSSATSTTQASHLARHR